MFKTRCLFWLSLIPLAIAFQTVVISSSCAQDKDIPSLHSRIIQLEKRVMELESLLAEMEAGKSISTIPTGWQNKKNWRSLTQGMRDRDVKEILGEPSKVIQGVKTLWYYPNLYCGYVTFDEKGQLIGWNEP